MVGAQTGINHHRRRNQAHCQRNAERHQQQVVQVPQHGNKVGDQVEDIAIGVECLLADDPVRGGEIATQLDSINRERRQIEGDMREQALSTVGEPDPARRSLIVFGDDWHEGVVGLIASRLKERHHRPTVAFAPSAADPSNLRGSGRSIAGVHLRDTLDLVSKRHPTLIDRFGGHAMAAGLSMRAQGLVEFTRAFEQAVLDSADPSCFERTLATDGPLLAGELDLSLVEELDRCVWGQGFAAPLFSDVVEVTSQRLVKDRHLKLELKVRGRKIDAMAFGRAEPLPARARIAYRVSRNEWNGLASLQLLVDAVEEPDTGRA